MAEFIYKPGFGVIVIANDEDDQKNIYEFLLTLGFKCKIVCV